MALANQFRQPIDFYGVYGQPSWAGYVFKEVLGYASGRHTGDDYNGPGAGNADLGMQIQSIANGTVRWTGNRNDLGFGNVTIIEYQLSPTIAAELGCTSLFGRHMHQNTIEVSVGQEVGIGQRIGSVGNTGTQWAHLHLDLYKNTIDGGGVHFRYDKDTQLASYLSPYQFIQAHLNAVDTAASLAGYQREVGNASGVNERAQPNTSSTITREFAQGEVLDLKGFVEGENYAGNKYWYVGKYAGRYFWSGSFTDTGLHDLPNLTPVVPPSPVPTPEPYKFDKSIDSVTEIHPAGLGSFEVGNFPASPDTVVIHDMGTDGKDDLDSTIAWFSKPDNVSAHFGAQGKRRAQFVKLGDRAYHAGPNGNNFIGIEVWPGATHDPATVQSVRQILAELEIYYKKQLKIIKHTDVPGANTLCGDDIVLQDYDLRTPYIPGGGTTPTPTPVDYELRIKALEADRDKVVKFLSKTFKEF